MSGELILVVDNDEAIREVIGDVLALDGYEVALARHGREALERLYEVTAPSLILLDWHMPDMNGRQFLARHRTDARLSTIPVLVMTGTSRREEVLDMGRQAGSTPLLKPMSIEALLGAIKSRIQQANWGKMQSEGWTTSAA